MTDYYCKCGHYLEPGKTHLCLAFVETPAEPTTDELPATLCRYADRMQSFDAEGKRVASDLEIKEAADLLWRAAALLRSVTAKRALERDVVAAAKKVNKANKTRLQRARASQAEVDLHKAFLKLGDV